MTNSVTQKNLNIKLPLLKMFYLKTGRESRGGNFD